MNSTTVTVSGMTCEHCVRAVTEELTALDDVTEVTIDLHAGGDSPVTITSSAPLDPSAVRAAVEEAGYTATA
ncbi:heavy-metal-associated domain-containing protein [Segeticoccus rhizosphaerae]|uniref:heavy-metal-associated domain-containing protein n=1 Tax=Segeticoccus rhizosphaerae TaxID=1104777 RepID=UPI0010C0D091|nr:heavy metal-associated domain-containing protein [Ornithinicoccus soli]